MSKDSHLIEIGKIIGFHGIKGEVKIDPYTDYPERIGELEELILADQIFPISSFRVQKGKVFLKFKGINNRTEAEKYRNYSVYIDRSQVDDLEEDEYLLIDLIGNDVFDKKTDKKIGVLKDIRQTAGPVDNFIILDENKEIYVPALKEIFTIDPETLKITADIPEEYYNL